MSVKTTCPSGPVCPPIRMSPLATSTRLPSRLPPLISPSRTTGVVIVESGPNFSQADPTL